MFCGLAIGQVSIKGNNEAVRIPTRAVCLFNRLEI
jgi:hypothetical protein